MADSTSDPYYFRGARQEGRCAGGEGCFFGIREQEAGFFSRWFYARPFAVPTVVDGKVYVGTANELNVCGLLP